MPDGVARNVPRSVAVISLLLCIDDAGSKEEREGKSDCPSHPTPSRHERVASEFQQCVIRRRRIRSIIKYIIVVVVIIIIIIIIIIV